MRAPFFAVVCAAIFAAVLATSFFARAQDEMEMFFGQQPKPYIDPKGFWAAILPAGFDCKAKARHVECSGNRGARSLLTVDVIDVPASATADIAMLNQLDRFKQKPHFKLISKGTTKIDKIPAVTVSFTYDHLNSVELAVGVQQLIFVRSGKLYLLHFESGLGDLQTYRRDLEQLYRSFHPARLDAGGNPILEDLKPRDFDPDKLSDVDRALKNGY